MQQYLTKAQADFWNTIFRKGHGEFAYRNNLDLGERIRFPYADDVPTPTPFKFVRKNRVLVGIGGGKDSIVAIELLKEQKYLCTGFIVETYRSHEIVDEVCEVAGITSLKILRILDEKIFQPLPGSFAGHIPISAIYAFLGTLAAVLYDYQYVVVGNEHSSNFGNVEHNGEVVNHQWSKSAEFETLFQNYIREYVTSSVTYFSILRPFYEIRIAELFARHSNYFQHFTSCNKAFRIDEAKRPKGLWCCECPKCAFVFLILAPFIERKELINIFGRDLLNDPKLEPLFQDILGFGTMKPFDCVGTFDEAQAALYLIRNTFADSPVVQTFFPRIEDGETLIKMTTHAQQALTVPTRFRFCGMKNTLILGHGKEGLASEAYLHKTYPNLDIGVADEATDTKYLDEQDRYDIALKTPGIPKKKVRAQYTTATNIFFSEWKGKTIGVTGSKGKSTTASLIYVILKNAGLKVHLAGNIGVPMLDLLSQHSEEDISVLELSSYQLDDIEFSPHIAVVTNLFPDHMDYHDGVERYYEAKKNIIRFQEGEDVFVYNPRVPELQKWVKDGRSKAMPFVDLPFDAKVISLLGEHNIDNVRAAVTVARLFDVPDKKIEEAVRSFKGLPHRLELVGEFNGILFYDDAISTTPESTIAALRAIPDVGTLFLGGNDRGYDFAELEKEVRSRNVKNIVLFPESGKRMFADRTGLNIFETSDMKEAVEFAYKNTPHGSACLLSCASPSYGLWKNFEEKGDQFVALVKAMGDAA